MTGVVVVKQKSVLIVKRSAQVIAVNKCVSRVIAGAVRLVQNFYQPGSGVGYVHTQAPESALWTINHNLGVRPSVAVTDSGGMELDAEVQHASLNQCRVIFNTPTAGQARLN